MFSYKAVVGGQVLVEIQGIVCAAHCTPLLVKVYFESFVILDIVEVNGWRHALASLPVRKEVLVSVEWEAVCAHELVWT
jgi:hypothetical protein